MAKWNEQTVTEEAGKYESRSKFFAGNRSAYNVAQKLNLMDTLFPLDRSSNWNEHTITTESCKYKTRSEFFNGNRTAYNAAHKLGMIETLFPTKEELSKAEYFEKVKKFVLAIASKRHDWRVGELNDAEWKQHCWNAIIGTARIDGGLTRETFPAFLAELNADTSWLTGFEFSVENMTRVIDEEVERKHRVQMEKEREAAERAYHFAKTFNMTDAEKIEYFSQSS